MRLTASIAGLFLCAIVFATNSSQVSAEAPYEAMFDSTIRVASVTSDISVLNANKDKNEAATEESAKPKPVEHKIGKGESLSEIAKKYETTWLRLYAKNTQIKHPDIINTGEVILIPAADEKLADRELPVEPVVQQPVRRSSTGNAPRSERRAAAVSVYTRRGTSSGNTYTYGYCTWYVKNKRPDLPNNLGNADTWVSRARAQGIPTGSAPRVGAVGQRGMHVVYVERVNGDGTIFISEMNREGWNVTSTRTVPASYFTYIY